MQPILPGDGDITDLDRGDGFVAETIRPALSDVIGWAVCGNIGWDAEGNPTICIQRSGLEHSHG